MAGAVSIRFDTRAFERDIRRLADVDVKRVMAKALNRTAFEMREAEATEARTSFQFAGSQTREFIASPKTFVFDGATPEKLEVRLYPRPAVAQILAQQALGEQIVPGKGDTGPVFEGEFAIPYQREKRLRTGRGRLPKGMTPQALLAKRGKRGRSRGYRAGKYIFERVKGEAKSKLRFVLVTSADLKPLFDFYGVARRTAERVFAVKAREEFDKLRRS